MDNSTSTVPKFGREGLIWVTCGPNQFHFPRDVQPQALTAGHIGLRYKSLDSLTKRLIKASSNNTNTNKTKCFESYEIVPAVGEDDNETIMIKIKDWYGTMFHCREGIEKKAVTQKYKQSVVKLSDEDKFGDVAVRYGLMKEDDNDESRTDCRGIDYVEFDCPKNTAENIAQFYESIFDATTFVVQDDDNNNIKAAAYIALGDIDVINTTSSSRELRQAASQCLIFRETTHEIPEYDGHHIALYVGDTPNDTQDFERAFHKAKKAGLLSTNWRDAVDVYTLEEAKSQNQFRIQHIVDRSNRLCDGQPSSIFQLEHEIRSVKHPTWPGRTGRMKL